MDNNERELKSNTDDRQINDPDDDDYELEQDIKAYEAAKEEFLKDPVTYTLADVERILYEDVVPPLVQLPTGEYVCPGSPKTCIYAGWNSIIERLCDRCEHYDKCYPVNKKV